MTSAPARAGVMVPGGLEGLTAVEVTARRRQYGRNELHTASGTTLPGAVWASLTQPLVLILLAAAAASGALGDRVNAVVIALLVLLSVVVDVTQTWRSARAAERLSAHVAPTAQVRRDGAWGTIPRAEVVPGDVIRLEPGELVPADARVVHAQDLHVQEAALSGESMPQEKRPGTDEVFLGTAVVSGHGEGVVTRTGRATTFGEVAARLTQREPETAFEQGLRDFGLLILKTVLGLVLCVVVIGVVRHRGALDSLLFAVALAVGLTPEFLPMITAVTLSVGALRLARQQVIVKRLAALQNLGSIDVLFSDKTGTITQGEMTVTAQVDAAGHTSDRVILLAYLASLHGSGVTDPATEAVLKQAHLNPLDEAILHAGHPDVQGYVKVSEVPFDFERRRQSVVVRRGADQLLLVKGAPESVLAVCQSVETSVGTVPLDSTWQSGIDTLLASHGNQGERVVAVAWRAVPRGSNPRVDDERDLTLSGFLCFADPLMPDVPDLIRQLRDLGITLKVLSGYDPRVARHVCAQAGLDVTEVALGAETDHLDSDALGALADRVSVFARMSPAQKERLIRAQRRRGHVVGYMGDGINDAPSLRAADIGISVAGATGVAREAADLILLRPHLDVVLLGVVEGRRALANVMKYLLMGTSSNFGNVFSMAVAALALPFLPMRPTQILVNNFLYDVAQLPLPGDQVDDTFTARPRRWDLTLVRRFMLRVGPVSSAYDLLTFWVLLRVFHADEATFQTGWFVESLATQTLVIFVIRRLGGHSAPSRALVLSATGVVMFGALLPFTGLGGLLGFTPLPALYWVYVAAATGTYLALVAGVRRRLVRLSG